MPLIVPEEYIIVEKATGVQLFEVWGNMNELQRLRLIENITKIENQLSPIRFPAYGNLYFRHSIAEDSRILLDPCIDPSGSYCVGPACDVPWFDTTTDTFQIRKHLRYLKTDS